MRAKVAVVAALVLLAAAAWMLWRKLHPPALFPAASSVLVVTVDTLRPDALGFIGHRNDTPAIDALAQRSVRFTHAVTAVPLTLPAHTSLFTGLYPTRHGVHDNGQVLAAAVPTLAAQFKAHGYATAAFVSGFVLRHEFGLDSGFDRYDDTLPSGDEGWRERRAPATVAAASAWIAQQNGPWFLWVHFYDAHSPYDPPREFWQPGPQGPYLGEVAAVDAAMETLLEAARKAAGERLLTVLTADHGEAFGEHGEIEHGYFVYDTTVAVPLLISYPGVLPPGDAKAQPSLVDVAPTVLAGFDWESPTTDGVSLLPLLRGEAMDVPPAYVETEVPWNTYGWAPLHALRDAHYKFIDAPQAELYRLDADPGESHNLHAAEPQRVAQMTMALDRRRVAKPIAAAATTDDARAIANLQSLGYVGAGAGAGAAPEGLPDPKTRLELRQRLQQAEVLIHADQLDAARKLLTEVLEADPDNRYALLRAGLVALRQNDVAAAVPWLAKAVEKAPAQAEAHYALADALTRAKRYDEAATQWMETVRLQPRRAAAWSNLGSVLGWSGHPDRAVGAFREAARVAPEDASIAVNLAEAEYVAGQRAEAAAHFLALAEKQGDGKHALASTLGVIYAELEQPERARPWLQRARAGEARYADGQYRLAALLAGSDADAARAALERACAAADADLRGRIAQDPALHAIAPEGCGAGVAAK